MTNIHPYFDSLGGIKHEDADSRPLINPGAILIILLAIIGGTIVQKAIAQLVGYNIHLPLTRGSKFSLTPVALSFGWFSYGFSNLVSVLGGQKLMPDVDSSSFVVNCSNGFSRETQSWALNSLLKDHEKKFPVDPRNREEGGRAESLRVDIFDLGRATGASTDLAWWFGWSIIAAQFAIAMIPLILNNDETVLVVTAFGNLLAILTCALPQWTQEKWAGRKLGKEKVTCLTRGNGSLHIMVLKGGKGSWDLESLATGRAMAHPATTWVSLVLAASWAILVLIVSNLTEQALLLGIIGGLGMLQNVITVGMTRSPGAHGFHLTPFNSVATIIGTRQSYIDDSDSYVNLECDLPSIEDGGVPEWLEPIEPQFPMNGRAAPGRVVEAIGVQGALIELEKWVPTAGMAMLPVFFPGGLTYNDSAIRDNVHKKFWKHAFHTSTLRKKRAANRA